MSKNFSNAIDAMSTLQLLLDPNDGSFVTVHDGKYPAGENGRKLSTQDVLCQDDCNSPIIAAFNPQTNSIDVEAINPVDYQQALLRNNVRNDRVMVCEDDEGEPVIVRFIDRSERMSNDIAQHYNGDSALIAFYKPGSSDCAYGELLSNNQADILKAYAETGTPGRTPMALTDPKTKANIIIPGPEVKRICDFAVNNLARSQEREKKVENSDEPTGMAP